MAGKWIRKYAENKLTAEERGNYEQIKCAIEAGVNMDYETFIQQNETFQAIWVELFQASISEKVSMICFAFGLKKNGEDILNYTYKDQGEAILRGAVNG